MLSSPALSYLLAGVLWLITVKVVKAHLASRQLAAIPSVPESSGIISSWFAAFRALKDGHKMVEEGYRKYYGRVFRIPTLTGWKIVVGTPKLIEEYRLAKDDYLSFHKAAEESLQTKYTMGLEITADPYHAETVRGPLTRNIAACFPDIRDEMVTAFASQIPPSKDWTKYTALATTMQIICRTSNRLFVGLPLCRNLDFVDLNITYTIDVMKSSMTINLFPKFLQPAAAKLLTNMAPAIRRAVNHLEPIIQHRLDMEEQYGEDWPGKPNDMLTWLIHDANERPQERKTIEQITRRILAVNFAAIHTTSMLFTSAVYALAEHPELVATLREEIETVISTDGWTKSAVGKMRKLDSLIKEAGRSTGAGAFWMERKVLKDFTFSDGTTVPAGNTVAVAGWSVHFDEDIYPNASDFDGLRFARMREQEGHALKHQTVSTSSAYVMFGHGKNACPGRFQAISSLTAILAHLVLNYDVSFENGASAPPPKWFLGTIFPDPKGEVLFRQRAT
ncbi:cytochrome P450 [Mycena floridula]|nr:cytochrome P450 [Mycena floridula]